MQEVRLLGVGGALNGEMMCRAASVTYC